MLGREHHRVDTLGLALFVIAQGYLAFGIGSEPRERSCFSEFSLFLNQTMCVVNRCRHQHVGLVSCIPEHEALIAGAHLLVFAFIYPHRNIVGLLADRVDNRTGGPVETNLRTVIANVGHHASDDFF